jgi:predicted dinucleotide-binding enzyme
MSYATIGFGKIGQALAKAVARSGIEVSVGPLAIRKALQVNLRWIPVWDEWA